MKKVTLSVLFVVSLLAGSCKKTESVVPQLSIVNSVNIAEGTADPSVASVRFTLSEKTDQTVTVIWSTTDGSAKAGVDYISRLEQELVFLPGELSHDVEIQIINDSIYEVNKDFIVGISSCKNAVIKNSQCSVVIENDDAFIPNLSFSPKKTLEEGTANTVKVSVLLSLSGASENPVSLNWSTTDVSAKAGADYVGVATTALVFNPGETSKTIEVTILQDDVFEMDDLFLINFTNISGATAEQNAVRVFIVNDDNYIPDSDADGVITPLTYPGMQLVWSDEFEGSSVNPTSWGYDLGGGGWGNAELQTYTNNTQNVFVADGKLNIVATKQYNNYYSARLITKGKKEFTYGRIDIRAKLPYGQGIWPALWMLGANIGSAGWPSCGEIDIMEYLGHAQGTVHGTVHYNDGGHKYIGDHLTLPGGQSFHDAYHVFTLVWGEDSMKWYVDYKLFFETNSTSIKYTAFTKPQFFIMNIAVGGNWPGYPDETTVFPQQMQVDYVRVFQTL
ncbi:MAG: family 16 glycosylhydrolase [Bacteroidetes bacterium]|nr:family 16 glycosylhydrolase [Bacteroidota bacterium]